VITVETIKLIRSLFHRVLEQLDHQSTNQMHVFIWIARCEVYTVR